MVERKFGHKKDKYNPKAYIHKPKVVAIPDVVIWDKYRPDVRDQGNIGSCTGFGIGANLVAAAHRLNVFKEWFSPTWIYNGARFIEGTLMYDEGAYPQDCLDWLVKKGCLLEHFWPYNGNKLDTTSPPSKYDPEAAKWPLASYSPAPQLGYFRVTGGFDGVVSALADGNFVSIGIPWPDSWMSSKDGVLPTITKSSSIAGGHEVCLYGYDKSKSIFYGMNSWGTSQWSASGKIVPKGCFTMPFSVFEVFKQIGGWDGHYIRVDNWGQTPTPPEPTPVPPPQKVRIEGTMTVL